MQADRELDAQVAEHIFGWRWGTFSGIHPVAVLMPAHLYRQHVRPHLGWQPGRHGEPDFDSRRLVDFPPIPRFSDPYSIEAAWQIINHAINEWHRSPAILHNGHGWWACSFSADVITHPHPESGTLPGPPFDYIRRFALAEDHWFPTPQIAICVSALRYLKGQHGAIPDAVDCQPDSEQSE